MPICSWSPTIGLRAARPPARGTTIGAAVNGNDGIGASVRCLYDSDGQLLSGSFMDYGLPRAADLQAITSELDESQPCTHNPLGAKGCGEAGAIAAPAAIISAVLDALSPLGVTDIDMPLTPEAVWRAIRAARQAGPAR